MSVCHIFLPCKSTMSASLPQPFVVSFTEMANTLGEVHQAHAHMIKTGLIRNTFAASRIIAFADSNHSDPSTLAYTHSVFTRISNPNSYVWNTIIRAYTNSSTPVHALLIFHQMLNGPIFPDKFSFPFVLKACSYLHWIKEGQQIHTHIIKVGLGSDVFIQNTLIHLYASSGLVESAHSLLDRMLERNVISWNAILSAHVGRGLMKQALELFEEMPERNVESWNFMVSGYVSLGLIPVARSLFDVMPLRDVVSWNAMLTGYARESCFYEVLALFEDMQNAKVKPNSYTLVILLSACANLGAMNQGEWIHSFINKNGIKIDGFLATALVDMYSKCGNVDKALEVFSNSLRKDISTWNSMISGLSIHGCGEDALRVFSEMLAEGYSPNEITFVGVLSACSRAGLLEEGRSVFDFMVHVHGIEPSIVHYGCLVDLLGRAGLLEEAGELMKTMPLKDAPAVWESLLSACRIHKDVELAEYVAMRLLELNPQDSAGYVQLSNIYGSTERWNDVLEVRRMMKAQKVRKEPGCSMIEVDGIVHEFLAGEGLFSQVD
ncbi:pentatricopeptide repeat-containing protein At4g18840 [Macadamia integrifolia]|uniref:pentatricopeptide repeat-containing protein At4g18840 n=1 Tax=Macadamia integrifolia TaxID=60698 RepID=UPI001C532E52|nr:pentatricopeptide repeat-containing protein At4g18840 [Macadamia integrifolia]